MKSKWAAYGLISLFSIGAMIASTAAWAGPVGHMGGGGGGDWNKGSKARSVRGGGGNGIGNGANLQRIGRAVNDSRGSNTPVLDALRGNRGSNTPVLDALRGNRGSDTPVLDALRNGGRGRSDTPILDGLRDRYYDNRGYNHGFGGHSGYGGHHGYRHDDDVADAYRDAAIANAVVNLVGIAVTAATQPRVQTVTYAPAPAPVAVVQPRGYYQTEKILISEGYYEDVRVHVPGGGPHGGHYEIRKRWNPPVYEYRPVWVVE